MPPLIEPSPHGSVRTYSLVLAGLLALAAASYALSFASLGALTVPVALTISCVKGLLVVVFFMELIEQPFTNRFVLVVALAMVSILIAFVAADVLTRSAPSMLAPS